MSALKGGVWRVKMATGDPNVTGKWTCIRRGSN
jgi:hypothetical protein